MGFMGLRIGNIAGALQAGQVQEPSVTRRRSGADTGFAVDTPSPEPAERIGLGFGENTVSVPGLAVQTIGRNMTAARTMIPTIEEVLQEQRARAEEHRAEALEDLEARRAALEENLQQPASRLDFQRAESQARAQTQQPVNTIEHTARDAPAPIESNERRVPPGIQAAIQAARKAFAFTPPPAAQFDVRA